MSNAIQEAIPAPYNALAEGRFYLFFMRLDCFFVAILYGIDTIQASVR